MKAMIHTEVRCEECSGMMQYHNNTLVKCNTIKCSQRGIEYHAPTIKLESVADKEAEDKKAATSAKRKATIEANKAAKEAEEGEADDVE